ncbi:efflux RND transporter permease subunit [Paenibacillus woosongensis]|uniref:Efflux RND transporter permease subunit n=1 Tax=Paenibacillus woosongensis TaxID=307580 RepID=A0AA95L100_9BACL|nr:efflux RND transporter permease subunit [Paenibacillus woosongensis]WHX49089.1 efflux RND transporter permease subunit [Paenibacillus woosongensis]
MNKLTSFSMKNIGALFIMIIMLFGGGLYAAGNLKTEIMPDISIPMVYITAQYPGSPSDVMEQVTKPIEKKIANMEGVTSLDSTSSDNFATIIVMLTDKADPEKKKQDIESLLQEVNLPASASTPKVATFGFASIPAYYFAIYGENGMSQSELDQWYANEIKPELESIPGYDHMDEIGARETKLTIKLDAGKLNDFGLTPGQVSGQVRQNLTSLPAGAVDLDGSSLMARVKGDTNSVYNLENMDLLTQSGTRVRLNQLGKVESISESDFVARLNQQPAIGIQLYKTSDANAVDFAGEVESLFSKWEQQLPDIGFKTIYDTSELVSSSISGMVHEGLTGALLAALVILLFLRNIRMTLIVLVSIPLSILITLLVMNSLDISLNILTLGGMFIAIGRVVDDSIVVIENIYSHLQKAQERGESVIKLATREVGAAITSSTLTTVGVFAPLAFVSGMVGQLFQPFAITLSTAMLASLLVALTVIPMLAKVLVLRGAKIKHHEEKAGRSTAFYRRVLEWSLRHRIKTLLAAGFLFIASIIGTLPFLSITLMPEEEPPRQFYFVVKMPYETSLKTMDAKIKDMEEILHLAKTADGQPQFTFTEALIGFDGSTEATPYRAQIFTEVSEGSNVKTVQDQYKNILMAELPVDSELDVRSLEGNSAGGTDFQYSLKGDDLNRLVEASALLKEKLKDFPEIKEVEDSLSDAKKELEIEVDQNKVWQYGLSASTVQQTVAGWLAEDEIGDVKLDNITYTTTVQLDKSGIDTLSKLGDIPFRTGSGSIVYLKEVAKLNIINAASSIQRNDQEQVVNITAKIDSQNKGGVAGQVAMALDQVELPDGVSREVGGINEDIGESFSQLFVAMGAAVFIVYLVMVIAFGNLSAPFVILFSLPLAVIGGLLGLLISGEALSITSLIGFMMLIGIVVTNAILLIDRTQQLRDEGYTVRHALVEAGMLRLRPIIMTAVVTMVAMLPLALGFTEGGAIISKGMAVVVIGGLVTSTILTLVVVPVVYELLESFKNRMGRLFRRRGRVDKSSDDISEGVVSQ